MSDDRAAIATIEAVLRGAGLTDRPDLYDGSIHSWRCAHPDRYGPCACFQDLVTDLVDGTRTTSPTADSPTRVPHYRFFRALHRLRVPDRAYYWLLDRLTDNNGWRPLGYGESGR